MSAIMLGNLTVSQIEERLGITFPKEIYEFMANTQQDEAENIASGKWHCFDIPFTIVCGDKDIACKIYDSVKAKASEVKEPLSFVISTKN